MTWVGGVRPPIPMMVGVMWPPVPVTVTLASVVSTSVVVRLFAAPANSLTLPVTLTMSPEWMDAETSLLVKTKTASEVALLPSPVGSWIQKPLEPVVSITVTTPVVVTCRPFRGEVWPAPWIS